MHLHFYTLYKEREVKVEASQSSLIAVYGHCHDSLIYVVSLE